jgi:hypothetical protein
MDYSAEARTVAQASFCGTEERGNQAAVSSTGSPRVITIVCS